MKRFIAFMLVCLPIVGSVLSYVPPGRVYVPQTSTPANEYRLPAEVSAVNVNRTAAPVDFLAEGDQVWVGGHFWTFHQFDGRLYLGHHTQGQDLVVKSEEELATPQAIDGVGNEGPMFLAGPVIKSKYGPAVLVIRSYETGPVLEIRAVFPMASAQHSCQIGLEGADDQTGKWAPYEGSKIYAFGELLLMDFPMGFTYLYHHDDGTYSGGFVGLTIIEPSVEGAAVNLVYHCDGSHWLTFKYEAGIWHQFVPLP